MAKQSKSAGKNKQSRSSHAWLQEHFDDPYVKKAQQMGYRTRASFKLIEIDDKVKLFKPNMIVVDLGAAPGGWSQVASARIGAQGVVIASDILPMQPLPQVEFIQGDFTTTEVLEQILMTMGTRRADVVLSDMAPNMSGQKAIDQPGSLYLAELALELAEKILKPGGHLLVKLFQGEGFDGYLKMLRQKFSTVSQRKPAASRPRSPEIYLLGQGLKN